MSAEEQNIYNGCHSLVKTLLSYSDERRAGHRGPCSDRAVEFLIGITNSLTQEILPWFSNSLGRHCAGEPTWYVSGETRSRSIHFVWQHLLLITRFILFPALQFSPRSPCLTAELSCNSKRFSTASDTPWIYLPRFPDALLFMKRNWKENTAPARKKALSNTNWILSIFTAFSNSIFFQRII